MTTDTETLADLDLDELDYLRTVNVDSPLLTAYESGVARALQGRAVPAGATPDLRCGHWEASLAGLGPDDPKRT